jgi:hypothetical protein
MNRRHLMLGSMLILTLAGVYTVSHLDEKDSTAQAPAAASRPTPKTAARHPTSIHGTDAATRQKLLAVLVKASQPRAALPALSKNPFTALSFEPPPPTIEPPKPSAPPLRFKFLGRLHDDKTDAVFLDYGGKMLIARTGDLIDGNYQVIAIREHAIQFEYIPLSTPQVLNF